MVVRPISIGVLGLALGGCGPSSHVKPGAEGRGGAPSGGSAGNSGSGTSGVGGTGETPCVSPSEDVLSDEPGLHARIGGATNRFTRDVEALVGVDPMDGVFGFVALGWKEEGACGQQNFTLTVNPGSNELVPGSYECDAVDPHTASGTHIISTGALGGASYYDGGSCSIELIEVGTEMGEVVSGTFSGILATDDGPVAVTDGHFRVTLTE